MSKKRKRRTGKNGAALQAAISLAFVAPAAAQPAPNARPQGGQVVAGGASIATGAATTTINQSTARAAIDWRSFDVGSNQSVIFQQPGASSVTLNRVTGPDPSAIAGRISANGQLVLTNPSGVTFYAGSQVNAQSVIVSAPGITNQNFMAGRMVFDQPGNPNARIENAGTITVKEAGLAALVAPSVANSGTITARLGHVVLAGAAAHTIDMYGDGLVSIDITKQVTQAPVGADGKAVTALVTNTGTIAADGGTIQLTARAADGVVSTLVQAGGRIQANTAGGRTGQIEIAGTGGSVVIEGRVAADGRAPGTAGGSVVVAGSDATVVAPTARVTANGRTGGGTVAIGTTLARARGTGPAPAGTSARTTIAAGARISADATASGDGGRVTVLSTQSTSVDGAITARGGPTAGNGGTIELSGETGFRLTGTADTSAPHGTLGTIVLDPRDLTITTSTPPVTNITPTPGTDPNIGYAQGGTTTDAYVTPEQLQALSGNLRLQATRDLMVANNISYGQSSGRGGGSITLEAGRNLTVNSGVTISVPGTSSTAGVLTLSAATSSIAGYTPAGTLTIAGTLQASGLVLKAGTGGIALSGTLSSKTYASPTNLADTISLSTTGAVVQTAGSVTTNSLSGTASSLSLTGANQIATIGGTTSLTATAGGVTITNSTPLTVTAGAASPGISVPTGQTISLTTDTLTLTAGGAGVSALSAPSGTVALQPYTGDRGIVLTSNTNKPSGSLALTTAETALITASTLQFSGATSDVTFGQVSETSPVDLVAHGNFSQLLLYTGGVVTQNTALIVNGLDNGGSGINLSSVTLQNAGNSIPVINSLTVNGVLALSTSGPLSVTNTVTANGGLTLGSSGNMSVLASAYVSGPNGLNLVVDNAGTGSLTIAGTVTSNRGVSLTAGTGGIALSGSLVPAQSLQITSAGPLTETAAGTILGGTLSGTATSVSLSSRSNTVSLVSGFTASTGDFLLVNNAALQVQPPSGRNNGTGISVPTGRTVSLVADSVQLLQGASVSGGAAVSVPGGTLVVAPYTAGGGVLLTSGTAPATGLSITLTELSQVRATTLQLGGTPGDANVPLAGTITIGQANDATIDLGTQSITRLNLEASGAVTQNAALGVTTLAGTASSLALANVSNFITVLDGFTAKAGDLALHTSSGLTISNPVSTTGNLTLSTSAVIANRSDNTSLLLAADVSGGTVRFDTTYIYGAYGVLQTAGTLTAGTLTGVASTMSLPQANQITNLGDFTATTGGLSMTDARPLVVTGAVRVALGTGSVAGGAVTLNAPGITQTATSSITTPELDGSASADTVLNSRLNAVSAMGTFTQSAGNFTLVTSSPELDFGRSTGKVTATVGSLTFVADAVGLVSSPAAGTSISAAALITFSPFTAGLPIALINTATSTPANNALTLSTAFRGLLTSDTLGLGVAGYTGPISIGAANESIDLSRFRALQVQTTGAVTQGTGSTLTVQSLNGTAGSIVLPNNNAISSLGQISVAGGLAGLAATSGPLTLGTTRSLTLSGAVSASTAVTLTTTAGLTIVNSLTAPTVTLTAGGTISEQSTSAQISANTLTLTAQSATLPGTGNQIRTLTAIVSGTGSVGGGGLSITDSTALTIAGGSTISGTLALNVSGAVDGGAFTAQGLTGNANSVAFNTTGTQISSLGPFTTTGGFSLVDARALTVAGTVSDPASIGLNVTGDLTLSGSLASPQGAVTLVSSGAITQPGGTISALTLTTNATGSVTLGQSGNQIGTLTSAVSGNLTVADGTALTIGSGSTIGGTLTVGIAGALKGGPFTAQTLTGNATSVDLNQSNQLTSLGAFTSTGGFSLTDARSLTVSGTVSDPVGIALNVTGGLVLSGSLSSPQGAVGLSATGAITQPGGAISANNLAVVAATAVLSGTGNQIGTLTSRVAGDLTVTDATALALGTGSTIGGTLNLTVSGALTGGPFTAQALTGTATSVALTAGNQVTSLGQFTTTAGFSLADARSLTVTGTVTDPGSIGLNVTGDLTLSGSLTSPLGAVTLISTGAITQPGGAISANTLAITAASGALPGTGNQIGTLTSTVSGDLAVTDATALVIRSGSRIGGTLNLTVGGALTGGPVTAQALGGSATSVALNATGNQIATLNPFTTTGGFSLVDGRSLTMSGRISDPASIALNVTGDLALSNSLSSPLGTVTLTSTGAITQPGGVISASTLTVTAASATLQGNGTGNRIGTLTSAVKGDLTVTDTTALSIGSGSTIGGTLNLTVAGALNGGPFTAQTLTGTATSVAFSASGTRVATLGTFTSTGGFGLVDARSLTVNGTVSDPRAIGLSVIGDLTLAGSLTSQGAVALVASGSISQPGGAITAATLTGSATGSALLTQAGNTVATLAGFTTVGDFTLVDARSLVVSAPVDPNTVRLAVTGDLTLTSSVTGGTVLLNVTGALLEGAGGLIAADTLTGNAGSATLTGSNQIATLGPLTTSSGFTLSNGGALTIAGPLIDGTAISLSTSGPMVLAGSVSAPTISLNATGAITQPGGTLSAQTLTGSAGSATLNGAGNQIASLGGFTTTAGFSLTDARSLTVNGIVSDPTAIALTVGGDLTLAASLSGGQGRVTLISSASIIQSSTQFSNDAVPQAVTQSGTQSATQSGNQTVTQSGGVITAGTLTGSATGSATFGQTGNSIATLAGFTTGGNFLLTDIGTLTLTGSVTGGAVTLNTTGAILEGQGGRIAAGTLTGQADSASLGGSNQVGTLGPFATTTGFTLNNNGGLTVNGTLSDGTFIALTAGPITLTGTVSAPSISLTASGGITQTAGSLTASGPLTIAASGALTQSGGTLAVGSLSGSAASVDLGRGGPAAIGQIAGLVTPGTIAVVDTAPLRISGTLAGRFVSVTSTGSMVLADGTLIRTDGQPVSAQLGGTDASLGSNLSVRAGSDGKGTLTQIGTAFVLPLTGSFAALRLDLPASGGTIALGNLQATNTDLVLNLGNGAAIGTLAVRSLTVLGAKGQAALSGTVRGFSGDLAAQSAALLPGFDVRYTLNGCVIAQASCSGIGASDVPSIFQAAAAAIASVIRPDILALDVLDLSVTRDRDDPTLLLPNISDKDY